MNARNPQTAMTANLIQVCFGPTTAAAPFRTAAAIRAPNHRSCSSRFASRGVQRSAARRSDSTSSTVNASPPGRSSVRTAVTSPARLSGRLNAIAALFGLGYIIGIKYAAVICAGSVLANVVLVPLVYTFGMHFDQAIFPGKELISEMSAGDIFNDYIKKMGGSVDDWTWGKIHTMGIRF